jgi:hypothetical protein
MKMRRTLGALLITAAVFAAAAVSAAAQSREDVRLYIPLVVAVNPAQAEFFQKNFAMEISAAGYTVTENVAEADYSLRVRVSPNTGGGVSGPAPPGEHQYVLQITLIRNNDNSQVVSLSFGFTELEEMYNHNLSLIYQTLANIPLGKSGDDKTLVKFVVGKEGERYDWWRNKWLYLRVSLDYPISYYRIKKTDLHDDGFVYEGSISSPTRSSRMTSQVIAMPGATVGLEVHFLYWMSFEANIELRLWDTAGRASFPIPGIGAQLKFPLKPAADFMVEPYVAGVLSKNNADPSLFSFTRYSIGAGIQVGVRNGTSGIIFFDFNYMYPISEVTTRNPDTWYPKPDILHWDRFVVGLSVGYKLGFLSRGVKREENSTWLFNNK